MLAMLRVLGLDSQRGQATSSAWQNLTSSASPRSSNGMSRPGHDPPFGIVMRRMVGRPDFLAVRGSLLPEDERLLAGQWLLVERSVHEVASVRRGRRTDVA